MRGVATALTIAALLALTGAASAQPSGGGLLPSGEQVKIAAAVADETLRIGERTRVTVTIEHPEGDRFDAPPRPERIDAGRIRVLSASQEPAEALGPALVAERFVFEVTVFRLGRFYFPPLSLPFTDAEGVRRVAVSPQVSLKVVSVIEDEAPTLRPDRGPSDLLEPDYRPLWAGGVLLVVGALFALGRVVSRRLRRRPRLVVGPPPPPPWEVALQRLAALQGRDSTDAEARREYFFELSEIVREYLGARFGFESLELTTHELLTRLQTVPLPEQLDRDRLEGFLFECDLVKFARYRASDDQAVASLDAARSVVEQSRPAGLPSGPADPGPPASPDAAEAEHVD